MKEDIINKGKDWFQFRKGMDDFILQTKSLKKANGKPKSKAIPNNTVLAPHSAQANVITTRP
jgi:hypothetical protein